MTYPGMWSQPGRDPERYCPRCRKFAGHRIPDPDYRWYFECWSCGEVFTDDRGTPDGPMRTDRER